ncbi:hypothetical protein AB0399_04850 [Streptomyces sp. NPDC088194]|uniref:hypothetical protein n=1 Tax=Streptomyces sp. NPDC088194 TaxID=3154931 RepID=UPI003450746E
MAEQPQGNTSLSAVVADIATGVVLALDGGHDSYALSGVLAQDDPVALAAIRVLGADVLAPYAPAADTTSGRAAGRGDATRPGGAGLADEAIVRKALAAYPPAADASDVSVWSYRGLVEASRAFLPGSSGAGGYGAGGYGAGHSVGGSGDGGQDGRPSEPQAGTDWLYSDPWPKLAHRASQLGALSLPGLAPAIADGLTARTEDLARGFVRAVRRRDWLQAAGIGRWLARVPDVPDSLGLDTGLVYVLRMSGGDPRVALHAAVARRFYGRGAR